MSIVRSLCILLALDSLLYSQNLSDNKLKELDSFLESTIAEGAIPGVVALVATPNSVLYHSAYGMQHVGEQKPMEPDTLFRIASMTKPVTSVAIMQLAEKGLLELDDPIGNYLPRFAQLEKLTADGTEPVAAEVTVRHLLSHTSGYGYLFSNEQLSEFNRITGKNYEDLPLVHEPGTKWTYGCSTRILGLLVEEVSGRRLDEYFEDEILDPLGMQDTSFKVSDTDLKRLVTIHRRVDSQLREDPLKPGGEDGEIVGDYGLRSTAEDYAKFLQMFLNLGKCGDRKILSAQSVTQMTNNQIGRLVVRLQPAPRRNVAREFPIGAGKDKFGLGFQLAAGNEEGQRSRGSYSWAGIFNTHFWVDPQRELAVVLMMQLLPFYDEQCIKLLQGFEYRLYEGL